VRENDDTISCQMYVRFECVRANFEGSFECAHSILRKLCFIATVGNRLRETSAMIVRNSTGKECFDVFNQSKDIIEVWNNIRSGKIAVGGRGGLSASCSMTGLLKTGGAPML